MNKAEKTLEVMGVEPVEETKPFHDRTYAQKELAKLGTDLASGANIKVTAQATGKETRWMLIDKELVDALIPWLKKNMMKK